MRPGPRFLKAGCVAALAATVMPASVPAQESVRVVEAVSQTTGDRQRYVVRELDEGEIKAVQTALREQGYIGIGWTGRLDDGTVDGLRRFQQERGLVECGCISYETIVALGLRPEIVASIPTGSYAATSETYESRYRSGYTSGIYYPIGIPIYVPRPPPCEKDPCDGSEGGEDGTGDGSGIPIGSPGASGSGASGRSGTTAVPPGIRPAPPTPRSPN